jgi:hypothetical protein
VLRALGTTVDHSTLLLGVVLGIFFFWRYTYCLLRWVWFIAVRRRRKMSRAENGIAMIASLVVAVAIVSVLFFTT